MTGYLVGPGVGSVLTWVMMEGGGRYLMCRGDVMEMTLDDNYSAVRRWWHWGGSSRLADGGGRGMALLTVRRVTSVPPWCGVLSQGAETAEVPRRHMRVCGSGSSSLFWRLHLESRMPPSGKGNAAVTSSSHTQEVPHSPSPELLGQAPAPLSFLPFLPPFLPETKPLVAQANLELGM